MISSTVFITPRYTLECTQPIAILKLLIWVFQLIFHVKSIGHARGIVLAMAALSQPLNGKSCKITQTMRQYQTNSIKSNEKFRKKKKRNEMKMCRELVSCPTTFTDPSGWKRKNDFLPPSGRSAIRPSAILPFRHFVIPPFWWANLTSAKRPAPQKHTLKNQPNKTTKECFQIAKPVSIIHKNSALHLKST